MIISELTRTGTVPEIQRPAYVRGLTVRSVVVSLFALTLMAVWCFYHELYCYWGGWFTINNPPNAAFSVLTVLLGLMSLLFCLRRPLKLTRAEIIVVYASLLIASPLMSDGGWRALFPAMIGTAHNAQFNTLAHLPAHLWPHGPNLVTNGRFTQRLRGYTLQGGGQLAWRRLSWLEHKWDTPVLQHPATFTGKSALCYTLLARDARGNLTLIPGEAYLLSLAVKADSLGKNAYYDVTMQADDHPPTTLVLRTDKTSPSFDNPDGFLCVGKTPIRIPKTLRETLRLSIGLSGPGTLAIQDVQFMNIESVEGSFTGRKIIREKNIGYFAANDRGNTVVKPNNMYSLAGLAYLFTGLIPWKELWLPTVIWTSVVLLLMLGFFGINVILRKHWVENERVTLPVLRFYRLYFAGGIDEASGQAIPAIWQNKIMWLGFACLLPIVMMKGLHYYFPAVPSPPTEYVAIDGYFTNPTLKLFFSTIFISIIFSLLSIALLVERDILLSIWSCYLLFNFYQFFGKALNFNQINGYPWWDQQNLGAFFAYASLALLAARKHLGEVFRHILGHGRLDETREAVPYRTAFLLIVVSFAGLIAWSIWTEMGWVTGAIFFAIVFCFAVAASKIRAESSAFYHSWMPFNNVTCILLPALGGFAVFSMKSMIVASLVGSMVFSIIFLAISPMQVEMFELGAHFKVRPRDIGAGLLLGVAGGMIIYTFVHLIYVYGYGGENVATNWVMGGGSIGGAVEGIHASADQAFTAGSWPPAASAPLNIFHNSDAKGIAIGIGTTYLLALLRYLFVWFPIHPLGYVLGSSVYAENVWFVCLLAWLIRSVVERIGGAHAIRRGLTPFAAGMFLACIASLLIFNVVGLYLRMHGAIDVYSRWP